MCIYSSRFAAIWKRNSMALVTIAILIFISTDRRPDDTSIQVGLAVGALGLFAATDLLISKAWQQPNLSHESWLLFFLVAGLLGFCTLSASWAGDSLRTIEAMMTAWVLYLACLVLRIWADRQAVLRVEALLRCICISILCLSALVFSEVATDQYIHRYLINSLGMGMSIPNYYTPTADLIDVNMQFLSQHMATLSYLFWPISAAIYLTFGRWRFIVICAFTLFTTYSVFNSVNETALLALTLGGMAFLAAFILPRTTILLTGVAFSVVVLAIVPLTYVAHDILQLQFNPYIPSSGQGRIPIWYNVANSVDENFFYGHGVVHLQALLDSGQGFIWEHAHSHSFFLQTWYEVGLFGSVLILIIGLATLMFVHERPNTIVRFGVATFVTLMTSFATTAWELWVPWHLGAVAFVASLTTLLFRVVPSRNVEGLTDPQALR